MNDSELQRLNTLARFLRSQVALTTRPPVGEVHLNDEEASLCATAIEEQVRHHEALATAMQELHELIDFATGEWLDWSEDVAMGGGTGLGAAERQFVDQHLNKACAMTDRWRAIVAILKEFAVGKADER